MKPLWNWCIGCLVVLGSCVLVWAQPFSEHASKQSTVRILGDVNADGLSNISDALIVATYGLDTTIVIPNQGDISLGDANGDRLVNVSDALIIATFGVDPNHSGLPVGIGQPIGTGDGIVDTTVSNPVVEVNNLPVWVSPGVNVAPVGIPFSLPLSASDPDGDVLAFGVENLPEGAVFANGVLQWTPTFDQLEEFELSFSANDGKGGVAQTNATLAVVDFDFLMQHYFFETQLPSFVNIIFQVTDLQGRGVDNLTQGHFEVRENNQLLSPSESSLQIERLDAVPHRLKTVLVLDNSLSIGNDLKQVKNAAIALVQNIQPLQKYAIYEFSENAILLQDFTDDPARLIAAIQGIELGLPTTNLFGAVIEGLSRWFDTFSLEAIEQGFLIVFTDGRDTQSLFTKQQVIFDRRGKRVYAVGLGNEIDTAILSEIGNAGFFQIQDVNQLADRFARIQDHILLSSRGFYGLQYLSPTR
ncbi:MAG: VWA domain-containing protein, partial [Candidatus Latescibacteria bacterium]|nr:VWA domain-containing protein [Candidatus Latescibacterota bacterium]